MAKNILSLFLVLMLVIIWKINCEEETLKSVMEKIIQDLQTDQEDLEKNGPIKRDDVRSNIRTILDKDLYYAQEHLGEDLSEENEEKGEKILDEIRENLENDYNDLQHTSSKEQFFKIADNLKDAENKSKSIIALIPNKD
ncbi:hypothetical protein PGB90_008820 [Kerria lacca]